MPRKRRQIVWHKKRGRFIPSTSLKSHEVKAEKGGDSAAPPKVPPSARIKSFSQNLAAQIKKAVRKDR